MKQIRVIVAVTLVFAMFSFVSSPERTNALVGWVGAAGSPYVGFLANQPYDINVTSNGLYPSLKIDSKGYPCISWEEISSGNSEVFFARWNGTSWVNAQGSVLTSTNGNVSNNSGGSQEPSLVLDSLGYPYIVWQDNTLGNYEIFFAKWNGTSWVNAQDASLTATNCNISNNSGASYYPSLALDSLGKPCIAWQDYSTGISSKIFFAKWNGSSWVNAQGSVLTSTNGNVSNNSGMSEYPSLKIDRSNNPQIAWCVTVSIPIYNYEIFYARWNGSSWVNAQGSVLTSTNGNVSNNSSASRNPSLALDLFGNPCIAWHDFATGNSEIFFARWNGLMWVNASNIILNMANGNVSNKAGNSEYPSLEIDPNNNPCLAWNDYTTDNSEVYYARWNGFSWVNASGAILDKSNCNVSESYGYSFIPKLALDINGNPSLAWSDTTSERYQLYYVNLNINFDGKLSISKSVDVNSDGDYSDSGKNVAAGDTLSYKINWKFNQSQDTFENPYLYDTIPYGTTYVAGSASPSANISYSTDGGATWIAGEPPNGSLAGTQLRWDLSSLWVGASGSKYNASETNYPKDINIPSIYPASMSMVLDKNEYPNIAYSDTFSDTFDIFFCKWNGSNWVNASGLVFDASNGCVLKSPGADSYYPCLALDSNGNPNIVWIEQSISFSPVSVFYTRWNGSNWVNTHGDILDQTNGRIDHHDWFVNSCPPKIVIKSNDYPCVIYIASGQVNLIQYNGMEWTNIKNEIPTMSNTCVLNASSSIINSLTLDLNDNPCIALDLWNSAYDIFFIRWDGTNWVNAQGVIADLDNSNVSNNSTNSQYPILKMNSKNNPCISWSDDGRLFYAVYDKNNWCNIYGLPIDNTNPLIANISVEDFFYRFDMDIDSNDQPHFMWSNSINSRSQVFYAKYDGVKLINFNNVPLNNTNGIVSNLSTFGLYSYNMSIDSNNKPNLSWGSKGIFYVKLFEPTNDLFFSVKIDNPPTSYGMCNHATFRHKWDKGVAIESNEVCNTIKFNYTGTFTLEKGIDSNGDGKYTDNGATITPGTTLGYKLDWTFDNPNNDPLNGAYIYDTVPLGTKYVAGSSPIFNLSYSTDNGFSWLSGEPPDGSAAGTILRWKLTQPGWTNAQGQLVNSTNPNVSKNTGISDFPSLAVYKDGHPCIAWSDDVLGTTMVYYAKWNGTQWVNAAGLPFTAANGNVAGLAGGDPSLALDPLTGNPWIAFQSNGIVFTNLEIHIVKWNGSQWTNSAGMPATLVNSNVSNNTGLSWFPSQLVLDSKGYPCIVWKDNTTGSFQNYFARWNGTNWTNAAGTILNTTNGSLNNNVVNSFWPTISLDVNDRPYVAWDNNFGTNFEIYFAKWDGTQWVTASGTPLTPTNGNISNNNGSSQIPFLFTDRVTGNPCIAWSDDTPGNYEIYYAKWNGSAWVNASNIAIDSTNPNMSHTSGGSYLLSLALDFNNLPAISWEDDTTGNSEIYYSRWSGSAWVNAKGDAFTAANGIINASPARSWFPSLAFDPVTNNPNIAWLDKTPGNNEVYFAKWTDYHQTFTFSVIVDKPFSVPALSPICNSATFSHAFDGGNPLSSNSVCVKVKGASEVKGANLVIRKTAKSLQYNPKDTFVFQITVANNGSTAAENVVLTDNFPNELVFDSSTPSGQTGLGRVKFSLGTLAPNTSASFTLKFKLSPKTTIDDCITVINEAIATSGTLIVKDTAAINICTPKAPCELYIDTKWTNVVKGVRAKGEPVKLEVIPRCGSSPYSMTIDWGDGSTNSGTVEGEGESYISGHSFPDTGDFTVKITCVDAYGSTRIVTKTLK